MTDERGRGIFTPKDREFLRGDVDYAHRQRKYRREKNIPQRFREAILDLSMLLDGYGAELIDEALDDIDDKELQRAAAFLYGLTSRNEDDVEIVVEKHITPPTGGDNIEYETRIKTDD
jgi:hypothetical protein